MAKQPNHKLINQDDLREYRNILEQLSAHKKPNQKSESLRANNSKKNNEIIDLIFKGQSEKGLPRYKIVREGTRMGEVY